MKKKKKEHLQEKLGYYTHERMRHIVIGAVFVFSLIGLSLFFLFTPNAEWYTPPEKVEPSVTVSQEKLQKAPITYVLKDNESLWDVAQRYYGDPLMYTKIASDNNFPNPDVIEPGTTLILYDVPEDR